jgi:hypothetical protein
MSPGQRLRLVRKVLWACYAFFFWSETLKILKIPQKSPKSLKITSKNTSKITQNHLKNTQKHLKIALNCPKTPINPRPSWTPPGCFSRLPALANLHDMSCERSYFDGCPLPPRLLPVALGVLLLAVALGGAGVAVAVRGLRAWMWQWLCG